MVQFVWIAALERTEKSASDKRTGMPNACATEGGYMALIVADDLGLTTSQHEEILLSYNQRGRCSRRHGVKRLFYQGKRYSLPLNDGLLFRL